nr:LysR substrate-binding domain-containing protein [Luteibacter sp. Sphag1AF]
MTSRRLVPGGRLRIALPVLFGRDRVMPVLLALASQYPALEIDARFSHRAVDFADDGVDLAVRIGTLDNSDQLVARPLGVQRVVCCASPAYLAAHGTPHTPDDLRDHACLAAMRDGLTESWRWRDARGTAYAWSPHARLRFEHIEAVLAAALAGHGLAQLPGWLVDAHVARGALRTVLDEHAVEGLPIHAVWPASRSMTARLRVTIDALVASGCAR